MTMIDRAHHRDGASTSSKGTSDASQEKDPFLRPENEDDDGYDPYSDRLPDPEPLFERDPWG